MAATKPGAAAMAQRQEGSVEEGEEHRMRAALRHLQAEAGVLERLVYKHRNQHRGAAYFQYLLKVRLPLRPARPFPHFFSGEWLCTDEFDLYVFGLGT